MVGQNDKRMITATFACTLSGYFLPIQILYTGTTQRCHPKYKYPDECDVWHSENHWANQETAMRLIQEIVIPYVNQVRKEKGLSTLHPALAIFDVFCGQTVSEVNELLEEHSIYVFLVPSNCTDKLQP